VTKKVVSVFVPRFFVRRFNDAHTSLRRKVRADRIVHSRCDTNAALRVRQRTRPGGFMSNPRADMASKTGRAAAVGTVTAADWERILRGIADDGHADASSMRRGERRASRVVGGTMQ
jgi:hypothetical protein